MSVLNVQTKGSALIVEKSSRITSGGYNTVELRVTFDENWDIENGKFWASFYIDNPDDALIVELNKNADKSFTCAIPDEIIKDEGHFNFGVWCESDDKLKPSDIKLVRVYRGIVTKGRTGGTNKPSNNFSEYAKKEDIPTKLSQLEMDIDIMFDDELFPLSADKVAFIEKEVISEASANLINPAEYTDNVYIVLNPDLDDYGKEKTGTDISTSGYIEVEAGATYFIGFSSSSYNEPNRFTGIPAYNENKEFKCIITDYEALEVSGIGKYVVYKITIPEDVTYIRTVVKPADKDGTVRVGAMCVKVTEYLTEYPTEYIPYSKYECVYRLKDVHLSEQDTETLNPLYGKTILWNGDSICAEGVTDYGDDGRAWSGRIAERNNMSYKNYAVRGGTITNGVEDLYGIVDSIDAMYTEYPDADYIIIEGGVNDADRLGSILNGGSPEKFGSYTPDDFNGIYNTMTFCGALETIFYKAVTYWKGKKIGYIIPQKMRTRDSEENIITDYSAAKNNRRAYFETAIKIANKWGIPVLNLWDGCHLNPLIASHYDKDEEGKVIEGCFYGDGIHLTAKGYDYEVPIIEAWLKSLTTVSPLPTESKEIESAVIVEGFDEYGMPTGNKCLRFGYNDGSFVDVPLPGYLAREIEISETEESIVINCIENGEIKIYEIPKNSSDINPDGGEVNLPTVGIDKIEINSTHTTLSPNTFYSFGEMAELTLEFAAGELNKVNEYMFSFVSGETATVLTLPESVQWVNELTVEVNKRYEISIVDNIGLWCAVDLAVSE